MWPIGEMVSRLPDVQKSGVRFPHRLLYSFMRFIDFINEQPKPKPISNYFGGIVGVAHDSQEAAPDASVA